MFQSTFLSFLLQVGHAHTLTSSINVPSPWRIVHHSKLSTRSHGTFQHHIPPKGSHRPLVLVWGAWNIKLLVGGRNIHQTTSRRRVAILSAETAHAQLASKSTLALHHGMYPNMHAKFCPASRTSGRKKGDIAGVLPDGQIVLPEDP